MNDSRLQELESKVAKLETEIRELRKTLTDGSAEPWWKRTAGTFKGDPVFAEIVRLGKKIRRGELAMTVERISKPTEIKKRKKKRRTKA